MRYGIIMSGYLLNQANRLEANMVQSEQRDVSQLIFVGRLTDMMPASCHPMLMAKNDTNVADMSNGTTKVSTLWRNVNDIHAVKWGHFKLIQVSVYTWLKNSICLSFSEHFRPTVFRESDLAIHTCM